MMETSQLIWCVVVPAVIAAITCGVCWLLERREHLRLATTLFSIGWTAAVVAGLVGFRRLVGDESSLSWPAEFWQRGFWGMVAVSVFMPWTLWGCCCVRACCVIRSRDDADAQHAFRSLRWVVAAILLFATAAMSLPSGEGWEDAYPLHRTWLVWLGSWGLLTMWALEQLAVRADTSVLWRGTQRWWPLVVLAALAGVMYVAVTTYSALAVWTSSAVAATAVAAVFCLATGLRSALGMAYPAAALSVSLFAAGRFYSYEDHSLGSYAGLMAVAPAVLLVDCLLGRRGQRLRAGVAAGVVIALLGWGIFCLGGSGETY